MYDPKTNLNKETIFLTKNKSAWITVEHLPDNLKQYASENFSNMFNLHPEKRGNVLVFNKNKANPEWQEIECFRWTKSYLHTPKFDNTVMKSYMFAGSDNVDITGPLPDLFEPFYKYMKTLDNKYNQVIANWYENNNDHMPYHSDCESGMVNDHKIALINLNENDTCRHFKLVTKNTKESIYDEFDIVLRHGTIITMGGDTQTKFSHGVPVLDNNNISQRMSLSFRQF
jgi:hypothetical protein